MRPLAKKHFLKIAFRFGEPLNALISRIFTVGGKLQIDYTGGGVFVGVNSVVCSRKENAKIILEASNPKLILARGYAMVRDKETGKIITKASSVKPGQVLEIVPESGTINVTVNSTTN